MGPEIESFEPALLSAHGGDMNGYVTLRGDQEQLARVRMSDEFNSILSKATSCLQNVGVIGPFSAVRDIVT